MTTAKRTFGVLGLLTFLSLAALCAMLVEGVGARARADSSAIDFESPTYMTGSIDGQDGWSATGAYDYGVVATAGFGSPAGFAAQSFRISNAITSGSFGDWAFSKSLVDEAGEPLAANGGFSGGTRQPHFEVSFDIASAVPGAEQPGLQISVAPDRGDGARMSFLRFRDTPGGIDIDFAEYVDAAPFGTSANLAAGCGAEDDFVTTTIASGLDRSVPHNIKLVIDFVPGPRNDVVRVSIDGGANLVHCGGTWEDYYRYCAESQPPVDVSRTVDSLLLQARSGGGTAPGTLGNGFLVDNLNLVSGSLTSPPEICPQAAVPCEAPACATPNCLVDDATGVDAPGCCTGVTPCKTIQFAVGDASVGDVVSVAAGTYSEPGTGLSPLNISKTLTLCGAQAGVDARTRVGAETHITDPQGTIVSASNVVIDGFTIEGNVTNVWVYGLDMAQGTTGTQVYNNIIQNNIAGIGLANTGVSQVRICQNQIQNNNNPGSASGTGIYTDEFVCGFALTCSNFLVDLNAFEGNVTAGIGISNTNPPNPLTQLEVSTNSFDQNGRGIYLFNTDNSTIHNNSITNSTAVGSAAIRLFGGVDDLAITSNDLNTGAGWGIRITDDLFPPTTPNSGVVIHLNNIAGFVGSGGPFGGGLYVGAGAHTGPVNAECNWWDDPCGPFNVAANPGGPGQEVEEAGAPGDADFTPWLIAPGPAPASGGGMCSGTTCGPTVPDHFKCYKAHAPFQQRPVDLVDQFGPSNATVVRVERFCNPVNKNNEGISDPQAHLNCYRIREPRGPNRDVVVDNQFGELRLTTTRTHSLCVPAIKDMIGALDDLNINHFKCYRVRRTFGAPKFNELDVGLADQFEIKNTTVIKPFLLCNPVDKNGEGIPDESTHMTCYKIRDVSGQPPFVPVQPNVTDQFVEQDLQTSRRTDCGKTRILCVPSSKRIASPSGAFLDGEAGALLE